MDNEIQKVMSNSLHTEGSEFIEETSERSSTKASQNNSTSSPEAVEA
jgi:hypothetical protein